MKVNVDTLIYTVWNYFDAERDYRLAARKWYQLTEEDRQYYRRNAVCGEHEISDIVTILNLDMNNLYLIARLTRKWEEKHNWEKCFPFSELKDKILYFMSKGEF